MKFLIWDLPTRLFHWLLFTSVVGAFSLAELTDKETATFYIHVIFGVLAGLLMVWRIIWGFVGSKHIRWGEYFYSPSAIVKYFKDLSLGKSNYHAGHNPGSSIVILIILALVIVTVITGVFSGQVEVFEDLHENLPIVLMVFVGLHVFGVLLATKMNKEKYLLGMITGFKRAKADEAIKSPHYFAAIIMLVLILSPLFYFIKGFDRNTGLFSAPGTQWTFQIGEPEAGSSESED